MRPACGERMARAETVIAAAQAGTRPCRSGSEQLLESAVRGMTVREACDQVFALRAVVLH